MIKEFIAAWDANKDKLREYIASHKQEDYNSYDKIVKMLFEQVINPYMEAHDKEVFSIEDIHEINDGNYQGTLLYVIPTYVYQPSYWEYIITYVDYGSCSGCDTLLAISHYEDGLPNESQVEEYITLCLHIIQHCKYIYNNNENNN